MSFVTPALLAGTALIALPIVLHLVMRRQPQKLVFPALRFVQNRRNSNQTRMKLRHLLLLLLRCGLIVALALALARPALRGSGKLAGKDAPIAAALVFDNSLRMEYLHENQTRLQKAQDLADWLLDQLPTSAPVAVISGSGRHDDFSVDLGAAAMKVQRLSAAANARPLGESISKAIELLEEKKDEYRPEVYVFTDLSAASWEPGTVEAVASQLESAPDLTLYLVDVGVLSPSNSSLTDLRLASEIITTGSPLELEAEISQTGNEAAKNDPLMVGLFLAEGADADYQKRAEKVYELGTGQLDFSLASLPAGTHQGFVRVEVDDPLPADNTRYFTVEVRPPRKVLLLSQEPEDGLFLKEALSPAALPGVASSKYACQLARPDDLDQFSLEQFDAICLLDPGTLPKNDWQALADYVQAGGGLGIFLGRSARRETLNNSLASQLLPGSLRWQSQNETYLRPTTYEHPILSTLSDFSESIPWSNFPVFTYWELSDLSDDAYVVASFASGQPAIVERPVGKGRVVTMTTPVSDAAFGDPWNLLPTGPDAWPFLALADDLVSYLCGAKDNRLNYRAGQTAVLQLSSYQDGTSYVLRLPDGNRVRQSLVPGKEEVIVTTTAQPGNYRLQAGGQRGWLDRGFSVNAPPDVGRLERADPASLRQELGEDQVQIARSKDEIEVRVGLGRRGRELFPWLICIVAVVLGIEHLLANRFYQNT